jgi:hypothetical protein
LCVEQVEIDEYRDYEKAIGALREALKYLTKDTSRAAEDMAHSIERRIMLIEKFVQVGVLLVLELLYVSTTKHQGLTGKSYLSGRFVVG